MGVGKELRNVLLVFTLEQNKHKLQAKDCKVSLRIQKEPKVGTKEMVHLGRKHPREEMTRKKIIEVPE